MLLFYLELLLSTIISTVVRQITVNIIGMLLSYIPEKYICNGRKQAIENCFRFLSCCDTIV
jgi:hypothetical protein